MISMLRKSTLIVLLIFLIPSTLFAAEKMKTGYDLYHSLKFLDNIKNNDAADDTVGFFALGLLKGIFNGLLLMQEFQYRKMFPPNILTETERNEISKEMDFYRLNTPKEGIAVGQLVLIYKKYAENHPKKLSGSARVCVLESIIEAYGWK